MGLCSSSELNNSPEQALVVQAKSQSRAVEKDLTEQVAAESAINKLLLLGAGDSGKSTLFKQMKSIYGTGFTERDRRGYVSNIVNNIIMSIKTLTEQAANYGEIADAEAKQYVMELKEDVMLDAGGAKHILSLWKDNAVQLAYSNRAGFQLSDSTAYYFGRLTDVVDPHYTPTEQDVLRTRVPTTGIIETNFEIDGNRFRIIDVGGQRSERKKWIHCFEGVTAVLFVASISSYDQVLFEDTGTRQIVEALTLYEDVVNSDWFRETALILFLNKKDLFAEKIKEVPLSKYFPDFSGQTYEEHIEFMKGLFKVRNHNPKKDIYVHVTCATDRDQVQDVFNDVKDIIIKKVLKVLI
jgi:GTPase SAR1 family protein